MTVSKNQISKDTDRINISKTTILTHAMHNGFIDIWANPNIYDPGDSGNYVNRPVPLHVKKAEMYIIRNLPSEWQMPSTKRHEVTNHNKLYNDVNTIITNINAKNGSSKNFGSMSPNPVTNLSVVSVASLNNIETVLNNIIAYLHGLNWFNNQGICQRSCQLNCQVGCQVGCQVCVTQQNHDQHCGGSS